MKRRKVQHREARVAIVNGRTTVEDSGIDLGNIHADSGDGPQLVPGSVRKDRDGNVIYRELRIPISQMGIVASDSTPRVDDGIPHGPDEPQPSHAAGLADALERAGMTQAELASRASIPIELIESAGVGRPLDAAHRRAIAAVLGRDESEIFRAAKRPRERELPQGPPDKTPYDFARERFSDRLARMGLRRGR